MPGKYWSKTRIEEWLDTQAKYYKHWLSSLVFIDKQQVKEEAQDRFQTFIVPVLENPPEGLLVATETMTNTILLQALVGVGFVREEAGRKITAFPGFFTLFGRMPNQRDKVLFTAIEWYRVFPSDTPTGMSLITYCTADYFPTQILTVN